MHAWIYQISDTPIKETINEDTLYQGDGTDYDYCAEISEEGRKSAIETLKGYILPSGMFRQIDETTFEYQGGIDEWKEQWVERIQYLASRELVYIGEDMEDIIAQLIAHRGMAEDETKAIRCILQTQCNNRGYEWEFEAQ
jgi:hypothetical protein